MKNSTKIEILLIFLLLAFLIIMIFGMFHKDNISGNNNSDENIEIRTESTNLNVEYTAEELSEDTSSYDTKIALIDSGTTIEGNGAKVSNNTITITSAGTYYITGTLSDGNIVIQAGKNDVVKLILDNVDLTSLTTAPINGVTASKLIITLANGSTNTITDSSSYSTFTDTEKQLAFMSSQV